MIQAGLKLYNGNNVIIVYYTSCAQTGSRKNHNFLEIIHQLQEIIHNCSNYFTKNNDQNQHRMFEYEILSWDKRELWWRLFFRLETNIFCNVKQIYFAVWTNTYIWIWKPVMRESFGRDCRAAPSCFQSIFWLKDE